MATGDQVNNLLVEEPCTPEAEGVFEQCNVPYNIRACGVKRGVKRKRKSHKKNAERTYKRRCFLMERLSLKHGLYFDPHADVSSKSIEQFTKILDSLFCPNPKGELTDDRQNERHLLFEQMRRFPEIIGNPSVHEFLKKNLPDFSRFDKSGACDSNSKRPSPQKLPKADTLLDTDAAEVVLDGSKVCEANDQNMDSSNSECVESSHVAAGSDKYRKTVFSNDSSSSSVSTGDDSHTENEPEPSDGPEPPESSDETEPVQSSPKLDVRCILSSDQFPNAKQGTSSTHPDGPAKRKRVSSQMGESRAQSWNWNSHSTGSSWSNLHKNDSGKEQGDWQNKYYVNWDEPTFFNNENSHGVYFQDDDSFTKALNWTNKLYETLKETPVGISKKPPSIEDRIRKTAKEVKMFDAVGSTLTLTQSTLTVIKGYTCPQYWDGESCDKTCKKKHKIKCDEFPPVSPDEVFRAISARLMELERPPLEMVLSLIEWLALHNANIKILSFSKILHTKRDFNVCTTICGVFIKHLCTYLGLPPAPVVEYFLKFHYLMMKDHDHLTVGINRAINRLIGYCQVGTYKTKMCGIVRFLLDVEGYSLPFYILDRLLHELNDNPPSDIMMFKDKIKNQLTSFEKCDDPNFRARAYLFLWTYCSESSSDP